MGPSGSLGLEIRHRGMPRSQIPLRYDDFVDRDRYEGSAFLVTMVAQEQILAATNTINRFGYDLRSIAAWSNVFDSVTENDKMQALFEFVFLIASACLSTPYSIKQMFIRSICQISYQTNCLRDSNCKRVLKEQLNFPDADRLAARFVSWPTLYSALSMLNNQEFIQASDDYRNRINHGFPRRIEVGHTVTISPEVRPGSVAYAWGVAPPLSVSNLIPLLEGQYEAACNCFAAYIALIKEQHESWPRLAPDE